MEEQIWSMLEKGKERDQALISPRKSRSGRILKPTVRAQEALHTKHANLAKAALESSREVSLTDTTKVRDKAESIDGSRDYPYREKG